MNTFNSGDRFIITAAVVIVLVWLTLIALTLPSAKEEDDAYYRHYCEMVELWHRTEHLPVDRRLGWPPYKGECELVKGEVNYNASF